MVNPAGDFPDFTRGLLLLGVDASGNPVGVLVDSDGNLNAILKGQGATGLQTIAVDADGRIQVFVLDEENQWGNTLKVGNAELAGRLGSPVTWDWRGNVLLLNTFGMGQGAIFHYHAGSGSSVEVEPTGFVTDGYALHCQGGTGANDYAGYDGRVGINPTGKFGFALGFAPDGSFDYILVAIAVDIAGTAYLGRLKYNRAAQTLQYLDSAGAYQTIATVPMATPSYAVNRVKLVVDVASNTYIRALWNNQEFDLSSYALRGITTFGAGQLEYQFRVYPGSNPQTGVYIDHHIVTVNEPT